MRDVYTYWVGKQFVLIKLLRKLMKLHSNNGKAYKFHVINKSNISKYVGSLPSNFYDLRPAHQADYVRVSVICDKGGIWIDSDTLIMDNLSSLFKLLKTGDGFFVLENNESLCNGVFGSNANTAFMKEWKSRISSVLESDKSKLDWTQLGSTILADIKKTMPQFIKDYTILNGLDTVYSVNWHVAVQEFIEKPYDNYKNIERPFQPLIVFVHSVYETLEPMTEKQIVNGFLPLSYFIRKSMG